MTFGVLKTLFSSKYMYLFPKVTLLPFNHLDGYLEASSAGCAWAGRRRLAGWPPSWLACLD